MRFVAAYTSRWTLVGLFPLGRANICFRPRVWYYHTNARFYDEHTLAYGVPTV